MSIKFSYNVTQLTGALPFINASNDTPSCILRYDLLCAFVKNIPFLVHSERIMKHREFVEAKKEKTRSRMQTRYLDTSSSGTDLQDILRKRKKFSGNCGNYSVFNN